MLCQILSNVEPRPWLHPEQKSIGETEKGKARRLGKMDPPQKRHCYSKNQCFPLLKGSSVKATTQRAFVVLSSAPSKP